MSSRPILVTGATGTVGRAVVECLVRGGHRVRALARRASSAPLPPGVEPWDADLHRPESLAPALAGVERVFLLTPLERSMVEVTGAVIAAIEKAGVKRVVRLSAFGAGREQPNTLARVHRAVEERLEAGPAGWTHLRPNSFMQNFSLHHAHSVRAEGALRLPQGAGAVSMIDARDVAAVAAEVLTGDGHDGRAYELTGAEALDNAQVASVLTQVAGRTVRYDDVSRASAREALAFMSAWDRDLIMELYAMCEAGRAAEVTGDVERVLGRAPATFERFAREHQAAFAP